jgi:osmoprotectant transport system permease protein
MEGVLAVWDWFTDPANWTGPNGIPVRLWQHLVISLAALLIAGVVAFPVAILSGHFNKFGGLVTNLGNLGRAIPTFALLVILASWEPVGVGNLAAVLAIAMFAIPPLLTNTYVGIREIDPAIRDGAKGMGMSNWQVITRVELPNAMPLIGAGLRTTTVQVMATTTLAALVGSGGLGRYVVDGFATQDLTLMMSGVVLVSALAIGTEALLASAQLILTPAPLRDISANVVSEPLEDLAAGEGLTVTNRESA